MKQMYKYLLVFLLCMIMPLVANAEDNVCTYGKNLTITFKEDGSAELNQDFYETKNKDFLFYKENAGEIESESVDIKNQLISLQGSCPSKVYYCKLEKSDVKTLVNLYDNLMEIVNSVAEGAKVGTVIKDILRVMIPSIKIEKMVFLYNSKSDAKGEYLGIDLNSSDIDEGVGFELVDKIKDVKDDAKLETVLALIGEICEQILKSGVPDIYYRSKECGYAEYTGNKPTYNLACTYTRGFLNDFSSIANDYKKCGNSGCKTQSLTKLNQKEDELRSYCKNIIQNYNYDGDVEQDCIDSCFEISNTILAMRKNVGLGNNRNGECGFSTRLASWGLNIMKWIKYIVPVFVIIFGIFDFIKAIGADKEDEMKKSQKKFITRLIAAALIFIIPFILEFVLDKFGFTEYIDGCGVIEEIG